MAARYDFLAKQGATFQKSILWTAPDDGGVQQPVDLTGCTAVMTIRDSFDAADPPFYQLTTANGGIVLGAGAGTIALLIPAAITGGWTLSSLTGWPPRANKVYDLNIIHSGTVVTDFFEGVFAIERASSR